MTCVYQISCTPPAAVDCGSPNNPENGLVTVSGTTFGSTATYTCNSSDYFVLGEPTRDCLDHGRWNCFAPTCAPSELEYSMNDAVTTVCLQFVMFRKIPSMGWSQLLR